MARREAIDQGLTPAQENAYQRVEEKKLYTGVLDSLLKGGKAVAAEQFLFSAPDEIWGRETLEEKEGFIRAAMERENAADTVAAILASAPNHTAAMAEAMRIKNKQIKQHVAETLEVRNTLEANAAFDARARGFVDLYTTVGNAGGDLGAVTEAQWQAQDGTDDKGKPRGEAKAARKLAKKLRQGTPVETDWNLYHELTTLPPKQLAALPIWDHADKLGRSEFLLLAERQQGARAALASGLPVSAAGQPGSLDAQLHAVARTKGWDSAAHAETRGLIEREIRAEIAEAVDANGGKPLLIAERRKLINEAAAELATVVAPSLGADDTLIGGAGDDTLDGTRGDQLCSFASHGAPDVSADDGVISGGADDVLAGSIENDTLSGGASGDTPEEDSEESGFFSSALDAVGDSLSGAYRIVAGGANDAVNGFLDVTDEMAQLIEGELPEGFAPYIVWDENGIRFEESRPEGVDPVQFPKVPHGGGAVEETARSVSRFVAGMALLGGVGKGVSAGQTVLSGAGSAAMFDPEDGNLATMAKQLGIESELLDWLDAKVGEDAGPTERLMARAKMAGEELFIAGVGALLAKSLPLLKSTPEVTQKAREALGGGKLGVEAEMGELISVVSNNTQGKKIKLKSLNHPRTGEPIVEAMRRAETLPRTHLIETAERYVLRREKVEKLYGNGAKRQGRIIDIVLGPPAAGKSTYAKPLVSQRGAILVDSDLAKKELPEWDNGIGAATVHLESRDISDDVLMRAIENGDNIVLPIIGRPGETAALVERLAADGYIINVHLIDLPLPEATRRAMSRFVEEGRLVDPRIVYGTGNAPRKTFEELIGRKDINGYTEKSSDVPRGARFRHIRSGGSPYIGPIQR
ncbi:MAG: hypothetical protein HOM52_18960 [Rhodospirillaceae bacterium]|nr:hypothetical protein [Rhodospirillaceae bacterium]